MADGVVWEGLSGDVLEDESGNVIDDCPDCPCEHTSSCESGYYLPDEMLLSVQHFPGDPEIVTLTWGALACGGVSEGWSYTGSDVLLCSGFYLREATLCCSGGTWQLELTFLLDGIQQTWSTVTGNLIPLEIQSEENPRSYETQSDGTVFACGANAAIFVNVVVIP